jgi:hypothetical protein
MLIEAKLVKSDPVSDIALLKANGQFASLPIGLITGAPKAHGPLTYFGDDGQVTRVYYLPPRWLAHSTIRSSFHERRLAHYRLMDGTPRYSTQQSCHG